MRGFFAIVQWMASQITHILAGEDAMGEALPDRAERILSGYGAWFRLGCQGPDIFYHNQRTRPVSLHFGTLAHRRGYGSLVAALVSQAAGAGAESAWGAWTLGFSTHAAVDRWTHPFIVHRSGWSDPARPETAAFRSCHPFYERLLDALLWERRKGGPVRGFRQAAALIPAGGLPVTFPRRLAEALRQAYPARAAGDVLLERRLANAFEDSAFLYLHSDPSVTGLGGLDAKGYEYLDDESGPRSVAIVYPEDFSREVDWANESGAAWTHPCEPPRRSTASYHELVAMAAHDAASALAATAGALDGSDGDAAGLEAAVGDGTLNVGDADGAQARPVHMDPLPLPELMARQYRMRLNQAARSNAIDRGADGI